MFTFDAVPGTAVRDILQAGRPKVIDVVRHACLGGEVELAGIKWISSFPANVKSGLPRAAASAAPAARAPRPAGYAGTRIAVVGAGVIARNICAYLAVGGGAPESFPVHDLDETAGRALCDNTERVRGRPARSAFSIWPSARTSWRRPSRQAPPTGSPASSARRPAGDPASTRRTTSRGKH